MELLGPFTIQAGEVKHFAKQGRYIEVITASDGLDVLMLGPSGEAMDEMRGALSGFYAEGQFTQLQVKNRGTGAQIVTLMVTDGRGGSRRQPGVVEVIDAGQARAVVGKSVFGAVKRAPVPTGYSAAQIESVSGRSLVVKRLVVSASVASTVQVLPMAIQPGWTASALVNSLGAAVSTAEARVSTDYPSVVLASAVASHLHLVANQSAILDFEEPIVLVPGRSLVVQTETLNSWLNVSFQGWFL